MPKYTKNSTSKISCVKKSKKGNRGKTLAKQAADNLARRRISRSQKQGVNNIEHKIKHLKGILKKSTYIIVKIPGDIKQLSCIGVIGNMADDTRTIGNDLFRGFTNV